MIENEYKKVRVGVKEVNLPKDWEIKKLSELVKGKGKYGANESAKEYNNNEYRYIRITDITKDGRLKSEGKKSLKKSESNKKYLLKTDDIVFARTGSVGRTYLYNDSDSNSECVFAGYLIKFEIDTDKICSDYLFNYTHSYLYKSWVDSISRSTTVSNINATEYANMPVIYPPLSQQKKIADIMSTLNKKLELTKEIIKKVNKLKMSLLQDFFNNELNKDEYKKVRVGVKEVNLPKDWEIKKLSELVKGKGKYGANESAKEYNNNEYRYIRITDITKDGRLKSEGKKSLKKSESNKKYLLKTDDIVFARTGSVGRTYLYNDSDSNSECVFAGYLIKFEIDTDKICSDYLFNYTHSYLYKSWVDSISRSTTVSNINATEYANMPVIYPPLSQQKKIADIMSTLNKKLENEISYKEKINNLRDGLFQHFFKHE
ncbi:MAG: restriction endonuclease subunit S [Bacillota bacterium]